MASIRDFIQLLEKKEQVLHVNRAVTGREAAAIIWELNEQRGPGVWFNTVDGSKVPMVANLFGTFGRMALALGLPEESSPREIRDYYARVMREKEKWIKPVMVETGPCKEVILRGDDVDLTKFPIIQWSARDGGPYITANGIRSWEETWARIVCT
jgi:4-hydroxy-3-polyprenylbenzoate decarboxylase